jgi:hypothetical protein
MNTITRIPVQMGQFGCCLESHMSVCPNNCKANRTDRQNLKSAIWGCFAM